MGDDRVVGGIGLEERRTAEAEADATSGPRVVRRRRPLPSGRAVVGGFLVAVAAVGTFAVASGATDSDGVAYVVARDDLSLGDRVDADDLALARLDIPDFVRSRAFRSAADVVGSVVVGPVARGELVQRSAVLREAAPAGLQVSIPVEAARAVDGVLQPGEGVDVLVTYGTGAQATTAVVARDARVVRTRRPGAALSEGRSLVVTLSVQDHEQAAAVAHAASAGTVTLVRLGGTSR